MAADETASEKQLKMLGLAEQMSGVGHWRCDLRTGAVEWSDEVYRIHGHTRESFDPNLGDALAFYHPEDRPKLEAMIARMAETGEPYEARLRLIRADGEERIVVSRSIGERDEEGRIAIMFGVFQDVTEQALAQARIEASEARYRLLADRASDIIVTYGTDGRIRYISPRIEEASGLKPEALIGQLVTDHIHAEDVPGLVASFQAVLKAAPGAAPPGFRYRLRPRAGASPGPERWFEARTSLVRDEEGRVVEVHDVVRDVTAWKAMEEALTEARDRAEAAARVKAEFLANMSHELRTPLTSVIGFSGLLAASDTLGVLERRYADRISTASEALLSVINDILDYSKLGAEAVEMDPQPFAVEAWARGAVEMVEDQCGGKGLALTLDLAPDLPGRLVGDEGRLRQVLLNFLSNACKFTAEGGVTVEVGAVPVSSQDGGGARLRAAVSDTGIGVSPDKVEALFDRFTQADQSTTRTYGGTGLGLAISRRLIEMMGGEIGVDSRPGEGATFWFEVPLPLAGEVGEAAAAVERPAGDGAIVGARILVADDAPANRELVGTLLTQLGMDVETVEDGAEAVEALRRGLHDLVLMDVHMPGMDGLAATRAIRDLPGAVARTPIVALTANVQPEHMARCREAGMDDHVAKPVNIAALVAALERHLAADPDSACKRASA